MMIVRYKRWSRKRTVRFECELCGSTTHWWNVARLLELGETVESWNTFWSDIHEKVDHR